MIEIRINEIINWFHSDYKDKLVKVHAIKENTIDECFKKVYTLRRSGRYDSARRYEFENPDLEKDFKEWESKNETIELYYGSAVVD